MSSNIAPDEESDHPPQLLDTLQPSPFAIRNTRATGSQTSAGAKSELAKLIEQVCTISGKDYPLDVVHLLPRSMQDKPEVQSLRSPIKNSLQWLYSFLS